MKKNNAVLYLLSFIFYILYFIYPHKIHAVTLKSPQYRIETNTSKEESHAYTPQSFAQKGYILTSRADKNLFTIIISQNVLDLLTPQDSGVYTLKAFKPDPFTNFDGSSSIPDTHCDLKKKPCNPHEAQVWDSSLIYGFGYSLNGSRFRPFSKTPIDIVRSDFSSQKNTYQFILKTVPSPDQPQGTYRATIHIIAFPDF